MKKLILIFFLILFYSSVHADQFNGQIEGIFQDSSGLYLTYNTINYKIIYPSMELFILDSYRSGISVTVDYNLSNEINYIYTSSVSGYPMQDFSKMISFIIGGISAMCFVGGLRLRFMG